MSLPNRRRMVRPKSGKRIPPGAGGGLGAGGFALAISAALRREFGDSRSAIKTIVRATSANERAVKNWYDGRNAPSAEFLVVLCRHSDCVLETVLALSGRDDLLKAKRLSDAKTVLLEMLALLDEV